MHRRFSGARKTPYRLDVAWASYWTVTSIRRSHPRWGERRSRGRTMTPTLLIVALETQEARRIALHLEGAFLAMKNPVTKVRLDDVLEERDSWQSLSIYHGIVLVVPEGGVRGEMLCEFLRELPTGIVVWLAGEEGNIRTLAETVSAGRGTLFEAPRERHLVHQVLLYLNLAYTLSERAGR